jgi:hypothetical protein
MFNLIEAKDSGDVNPMHSDPFKNECIQLVTFWIRKDSMHSSIDFVSGNTKGEHRIEDTDFNSLVLKTKAFIDSLPK